MSRAEWFQSGHRGTAVIAVFLVALLLAPCSHGGDITLLPGAVLDDYCEFYSTWNLVMLGGGLIAGGIAANTFLDDRLNEWYQGEMRSDGTDDLAQFVKPFGDAVYTLPLYAGAYVADLLVDMDGPVRMAGEWGERSLRTLLVGGPVMLAGQRILGAGRPTDEDGSNWQPFNDDNGVSGHSFVGAVPFINAAKMTDFLPLKGLLYLASGLCGFSRVNDEDHYTSQAFLGWWLAYLAAGAVDESMYIASRRFVPVVGYDCTGLAVTFGF